MSLLTSFARATLLYIPTGYPLLHGLVDDPVADAFTARETGYGCVESNRRDEKSSTESLRRVA